VCVRYQAGDVCYRIVSARPGAKAGSTNVDSVGAVVDGFDTDGGIARRGEKFEMVGQ